MKKVNYWKIASFVLCFAAIGLFVFNMAYIPDYNFKELGFSMSKNDFNSVSSLLSYGQSASACNIKTNSCILITKIGR